jgi:hypothetical protein
MLEEWNLVGYIMKKLHRTSKIEAEESTYTAETRNGPRGPNIYANNYINK